MGEPPQDAHLAARAYEGDTAAYEALVRRHQEVAFRVAYVLTGSAADAQDATQDGFVKAYTQLNRFRPGADFRPWLLTIVANEAKNRKRAEGRRTLYEMRAAYQNPLHATDRTPESSAEAGETGAALLSAVNDLPETERLIVGLRYFLELSEAETAAVAGIPNGTVKSRLSRALGRLRVQMEVSDG